MMSKPQKIVVIGATSSIAEHCIRLWIRDSPTDIFLVGRDLEKLKKISIDLKVRSPKANIHTSLIDFLSPPAIENLATELCDLHKLDIVLIAHGTLPDQQICQENAVASEQSLLINGVSPVLFAEAFSSRMERNGGGTIAVIGSVAGDRGRKSNYIYGSAKGLVTRYVEGMQHRFALTKSNVQAVLIKPGPTDTPMTASIKQSGGKLAAVEDVSATIVQGIASGKKVIYAPGKWAIIMMVIRNLPRIIFNKMDI